jgi:hypothetical protein
MAEAAERLNLVGFVCVVGVHSNDGEYEPAAPPGTMVLK